MTRLLTTVLATVALLLGLLAPAQAAAKPKFRVSISATATTIDAGQYVFIRGQVKPGVRGAKVFLQRLHPVRNRWESVRQARLKKKGRYSFRVSPAAEVTSFRVSKPKDRKRRHGASRAVTITVRQPAPAPTPPTPPAPPAPTPATVTVTAPATTDIDAGQSFALTGTASANLIGKTVELQIKDSEFWAPLSSAPVAADGSFSLSAPATSAGRGQEVRVLAKATSTTLAAVSGTVTYNVFGWYYLADRSSVEGDYYRGTVAINGVTYPHTIRPTYSVQYDLGRKCTRFRAVAGVMDTASSSSVYSAEVFADSVQSWATTGARLGGSTEIDIDLTGALRVRLDSARSSNSSSYAFAYGDARIRCAF